MSRVIESRELSVAFGRRSAISGFSATIDAGDVVGIVGGNGAGKSALLRAILGLIPSRGDLTLFGVDPRRSRHRVASDVAYLPDLSRIPRWLELGRLVDVFDALHPCFDRAKANRYLSRLDLDRRDRIGCMSRGTVAQVHLSLLMAVEARLLLLDEPTSTIDASSTRFFYDTLIEDDAGGDRTVILASHAIDEVKDLLTHLVWLDRGRTRFFGRVDQFCRRYTELRVDPQFLGDARALGPVAERCDLYTHVLLFDGQDPDLLSPLGDTRPADISDVVASGVAAAGVSA